MCEKMLGAPSLTFFGASLASMAMGKLAGSDTAVPEEKWISDFDGEVTPYDPNAATFYKLSDTTLDGKEKKLSDFDGEVCLVVNVASKWRPSVA